jgi:hypothetical protein
MSIFLYQSNQRYFLDKHAFGQTTTTSNNVRVDEDRDNLNLGRSSRALTAPQRDPEKEKQLHSVGAK